MDITNHLNLVAPLWQITLVGADCIGPCCQCGMADYLSVTCSIVPETLSRFCKAFWDCDRQLIHNNTSLVIRVAPDVWQRIVIGSSVIKLYDLHGSFYRTVVVAHKEYRDPQLSPLTIQWKIIINISLWPESVIGIGRS
jgi:hypothetical protein